VTVLPQPPGTRCDAHADRAQWLTMASFARRRSHVDPEAMARAVVEATAHFTDASIVAKVSRGLGEAMRGAEMAGLETRLAERGW